jgi:hypothetical protein
MQIWLLGYQCWRCGHQWKPRKKGTPVKCPACDSRHWQQPEPGKDAPGEKEPDQAQATAPATGTPAGELAEGLKGLTWPDDEFANDLEEVLKEMRTQLPRADREWSH